MHIVADENIPFVDEAFRSLGTVQLLPGRGITRHDVRNADVLLVRSVTRVDGDLLEGTPVRFVGSATIGRDHVDEIYLRERGIRFVHAPGSNADSVVEYVIASLLRLSVLLKQPLRGKTVGIVGCGNIGGRLARRLPGLGLRVLKNDPPLAEAARAAGQPDEYVSLEEVVREADVVTLHVPLVRDGKYPTRHLFDEHVLGLLQPGAWLLNTCRGAVVSNPALLQCRPGALVLDVWEGEPEPIPDLVRSVDLATPHIAGYSYDGKVQGTIMLYDALCAFLGIPTGWDPEPVLAPIPEDRPELETPVVDRDPADPLYVESWLHGLVGQMYDIGADDLRMRGYLDQPEGRRAAYFSDMRKHYPRRRTFSRFQIRHDQVPQDILPVVADALTVEIL